MAQIKELTTAPEASALLEAKNHRLQVLVGELLATNQELRFKLEQLKDRAESAQKGLACSCNAAGALWL